jgi:hypothetical protein
MRKMILASAVLVAALATSHPVGAVIGPLDGNAHPNVGVMVVSDANGDWLQFCGGVLISPTAFLTNFNCPNAVALARSIGGRAEITFDPVAWPPEEARWRTVEAGYVHPDADPTTGRNEYGIAVLAKPVRGITPAELPTLELLASIDADRRRLRHWPGRPAVRLGDDCEGLPRLDPAAEQHERNRARGRVRRRGLPILPRGLQRRGRRGRRRDRAVQRGLVGAQERYRDGAVVLRRLRHPPLAMSGTRSYEAAVG